MATALRSGSSFVPVRETLALIYAVFKVRISMAIMLTALAGIAVAPGPAPDGWRIAVLALAVLLSSASAGAFNMFMERDLDARMSRTRNRPFVTGRFAANGYWMSGIVLLLAVAIAAATLATNAMAAFYVFLGAFVYGVVYTDMFQSFIILTAVIAISAMAMMKTSDVQSLAVVAQEVTGSADWTTSKLQWFTSMPRGYEAYSNLGMFALFYLLRNIFGGLGVGDDPKYFGARSDRECGQLTFLWTWVR